MFGHTNAAMPLFPQQQLCIDFTWHQPCYFYPSHYNPCGWYYYNTWGPCFAQTTRTIIEQQACLPATGPVLGPLNQGDPVEQLQALRRQLEVTMAGLEAQERVLRTQQDASRAQQEAGRSQQEASRSHGTAPEKR
jgi:hypothetical protein